MARTASERLGIQGLGWIVRRTLRSPAALTPFYQAALGLRQLRPAAPSGSVMLWAGDIVMFESSALTPGPDTDARRGELVFLMRARDYSRAKAAMLATGARVLREDTGTNATLYAVDPDGAVFGLWQAHAGSGFPPDAAADAIWQAGAIGMPGVPALANGLQDVASINLKVADPVALAAFYHDALGLELLGAPTPAGATLALGRTAVLELHPGGLRHAPPRDRSEVPDVWILRVYDHDALAARLRTHKAVIVNQIAITGGRLTYALDPEGHLFGFQQRTPDLLPPGAAERAEDALARTLWASAG